MRLAEQFDVSQNTFVMWDDDDRLILQSHWRSFAVSIVASVLSCIVMLAGFAEILISQRPLPPPRTVAVEAILVEPPPPAEPAKPVPIAPILHPAPRKNFASIKPRKVAAPAPAAAPLNPAPAALPASSVGGIDTGRATVPSESDAAPLAQEDRLAVVPPRASARALCMPRLRKSPTIFARTFFPRSRSLISSSNLTVRFGSRSCNRLQVRA